MFPVEMAGLGCGGIPHSWTNPLEAVLKLQPTTPAHRL